MESPPNVIKAQENIPAIFLSKTNSEIPFIPCVASNMPESTVLPKFEEIGENNRSKQAIKGDNAPVFITAWNIT